MKSRNSSKIASLPVLGVGEELDVVVTDASFDDDEYE